MPQESLVIVCTKGPEDPEMSTIAMVMATAAQAMNVKVLLGLQGPGVMLGTKRGADHVRAGLSPSQGAVRRVHSGRRKDLALWTLRRSAKNHGRGPSSDVGKGELSCLHERIPLGRQGPHLLNSSHRGPGCPPRRGRLIKKTPGQGRGVKTIIELDYLLL
jgi:hypothetical protein